MTRITENIIEAFAIELLDKLGYEYIYAPDIAPFPSDGGGAVVGGRGGKDTRDSYEQVLLLNRLQAAVSRINSGIPAGA